MSIMAYYFIVYMWRRLTERNSHWEFAEEITEMHPVEYLVHLRRDHGVVSFGLTKHRHDYSLINWMEINEEMYMKYKDELG